MKKVNQVIIQVDETLNLLYIRIKLVGDGLLEVVIKVALIPCKLRHVKVCITHQNGMI